MKITTLCYIEKDGAYLMLHRIKKAHDENQGKWIGVGGKLEKGESPDECVCREVKEETGLTLTHFQFIGVITFISDIYEDEYMMLYKADGFEGELTSNCDEGVLRWIAKEEVLNLPLWEGDRYFLRLLIEGQERISMKLEYEKERLVRVTS